MSLENLNLHYGSSMSLKTMKAQMKRLFVNTTVINYVGRGWPIKPPQ